MSKSKKKRRSATSDRGRPSRRIAPTLAVLLDAARAGDQILQAGHSADDPLTNFDRSQLLRAVNALKSCRLLLNESHWEAAAGTARQLFEMLINVEHANTFEDREEAIKRYVKFGVLQTVQGRLRNEEYALETGRSADPDRIKALTHLRDTQFAEFQDKNGKFLKHWDGRNARALAEASSAQPLRTNQYLHLFVEWSEQVHAAPAAMLPAFFPRSGIEMIVEHDDREGAQIGAMCVVLFAQLWTQLLTLPPLDGERVLRWTTRLLEEAASFGGELPPK